MAAIFSHRATLHKVCAVLPQERTGFSMSELIATLEQQRDLPDDLLCSLLETDRYDVALFQAAEAFTVTAKPLKGGSGTGQMYLSAG